MQRQRGISDAGVPAERAFMAGAHVGGGQLTGIPLGTAVDVFSYDQLEHGRALIAGPDGGCARPAGLRVIRQAGSVSGRRRVSHLSQMGAASSSSARTPWPDPQFRTPGQRNCPGVLPGWTCPTTRILRASAAQATPIPVPSQAPTGSVRAGGGWRGRSRAKPGPFSQLANTCWPAAAVRDIGHLTDP
jgi:hypothetical protein